MSRQIERGVTDSLHAVRWRITWRSWKCWTCVLVRPLDVPVLEGADVVLADASVVIVDDQWANAVLLERTLRSVGAAEVHTVTDPREATAQCLAVDPHLVLLDLHMPGMDGHQVLADLRASVPDRELLPVLVITADTCPEARNRALQAGANDFLTRPLDRTELILRARNLLQSRARYDDLRQSHEQHRRRQHTILEVAAQVTGDLDLTALADSIVHGVTEVTEFSVAVLTLRDGDGFRRVAASGVDEPRIGLCTQPSQWRALLREEYRCGTLSYLIPPDDVAGDAWVQTVEIPQPCHRPFDDREVWTPEHGLVLELLDETGAWAGFLSVDAPSTGLLPDDDTLQLLELFARQAQAGLDSARLFEQVQRERDAADALRTIGDALATNLDLDETLRHCGDAVIAHSVGERATIYLCDPASGEFRPEISRGLEDPGLWRRFRQLPPFTTENTGVLAEVLRSGQPVLVGDVAAPTHVGREELELLSLKSLAVYPLRADDQTVGILAVDTYSRHVDFPDEEVDLVARMAGQAAVAIRQAQLHHLAQRQTERVAALHELTKAMTRTFDLDTIFTRITESISGSDHKATLLEAGTTDLRVLHTNARSEAERTTRPWAFPRDTLPRSLWDQLIGPEPLAVPDIRGTALETFVPANARSVLAAAHAEEDTTHLILALTSGRPHAFDPDDAAFVQGLVEVAALARRNARLYADVRQAAERDALTGLKNRRMYRTELSSLLADASPATPVAMAVLDVDDFKAINDEHGHDIGDQVLTHIADRLRRSLREDDEVYRIGGEEFTVVMPGAGPADATTVAERIRRNVATTRKDLPATTVSIGIAIAPDDGTDIDALFRTADRALYQAKAAGKDTVRTADR